MKKFLFVLLVLSCVLKVSELWAKTQKPNIVYILCDDLGYGDVQYLNPERGKIRTPHIDKMATQGMSFLDAHSGSSVCTPTRYGVLTGRYAWRSHLQSGVLGGGREFEPLISEGRLTVPALLHEAGYSTAIMGKWHLGFHFEDDKGNKLGLYGGGKATAAPIGSIVPDGPVSRGFDTYLGFHHSASMETVIKDTEVVDHMPTIKMLQFLGDNASEYIAKQANEDSPFFLYLALNSPHSPVVPSKDWQGKSGIGAYGDFVMETDDIVGRVIKSIEESGLSDNTIIIFTSDNGCSYPASKGKSLEDEFSHYPSAQYRGYKSDIWEGGHRVPYIVRWDGNVKPNTINTELICHTNLMATCADIVGIEIPKNSGEDSFSILNLLEKKRAKSKYEVVVHHSINGKFSIRRDDWKLELCAGSGGWTGKKYKNMTSDGLPELQLYNLSTDEREQNNISAEYPEIVEELLAELETVINRGRSTEGDALQNDVPVDMYKK